MIIVHRLQGCPSGEEHYCNYNSNLVLKFHHFGADERLLYYSKKFAGEWTDCQNIRCKFETSTSSVGGKDTVWTSEGVGSVYTCLPGLRVNLQYFVLVIGNDL